MITSKAVAVLLLVTFAVVNPVLANKKDDVQGNALLSGWFKNDHDNQSDKLAVRLRSSLI